MLVDIHVALLTFFILPVGRLLSSKVLNNFSNSFWYVIIPIPFHADVLPLVFILNSMLLIHTFTYTNSKQS